MSEDATTNEIELNHDGDNEATEADDADKSKERKHDWGAADLVIVLLYENTSKRFKTIFVLINRAFFNVSINVTIK